MANVQRVLVGAENFGSALIPGDPLKKGAIITVSEEVAVNLDSHVRRDIANNAHPVFVDPSDPLAAPYVGQKAPVKKRRASRKKTVKKPENKSSDSSKKDK